MEIDMRTTFFIPLPRQVVLDSLKKYAKSEKKNSQSNNKLSWFQDQLAMSFGYNNWALLHKHVLGKDDEDYLEFEQLVHERADVVTYLPNRETEEDAERKMKDWIRSTYSPLVEWAYYDSESENGYSADGIDVSYCLQEEFDQLYPLELIQRVAEDLELNEGPWGDEDLYMGRD
jgi:hypothetical protein